MKIFFTYQGEEDKYFYSFNVSSSLTVEELLQFKKIQDVIDKLNHKLTIAVNGELLDGNFKPKPNKYRLKEGERVELLRPLRQDPKERRLKKI
jgi:putative ubiquitin-RnfH superfamily antitoxin RatB of RatAB toxin-antitoxin module